MGDPPLYVVAGATGYLGGHVVRALKERGVRVRALARDASRLGDLAPLCDDVFVGEATRPETLKGLCDGARGAFSSLGVSHIRRRPTIWDVDERANRHVVDEALRAGVERFGFVSVIHGEWARRICPVAEARERVVDRLRASSIGYTVLRPTSFFNDMERLLEAVHRIGIAPVPGDGSRRVNPIHGGDLAARFAEGLLAPAGLREERSVGGPESFALREVAAVAFRALGRRERVLRIPMATIRGAAILARPFSPNLAAFLRLATLVADVDAVGEATGSRRLGPHLEALARDRGWVRAA